MEKENDREKQINDIFYRNNFEFMVQHGLSGEFMQCLRDKFEIRELLVIERKPKAEIKVEIKEKEEAKKDCKE